MIIKLWKRLVGNTKREYIIGLLLRQKDDLEEENKTLKLIINKLLEINEHSKLM